MMRKILIAAMMAAVSLAVPSLASAAGNGNIPCTNGSNQTINANVTVAAGQICRFSGTINGNLIVNGTMLMQGGEVTGNVNVNPGGLFQGYNYGVTIDKNLTITNPASESPIGGSNGFYGNQFGTTNVVKGNVNYTLTPGVYAPYTWPSLYFGGGTTVGGIINYSISSDVENRPAPVIGQYGLFSAQVVVVL
jgi:hypothetical protein